MKFLKISGYVLLAGLGLYLIIATNTKVKSLEQRLSQAGLGSATTALTDTLNTFRVNYNTLNTEVAALGTNLSSTRISAATSLDTTRISVKSAADGNCGVSVSVGGCLNINGSNSTSSALTIYSNQATPSGRTFVLNCDNRAATQDCGVMLGIASSATVLNIQGSSTGKGVLKLEHFGSGDDANSSALSIDLQGTGTASQGIFIDATTGGTTGTLLNIRNAGREYLTLASTTGLYVYGQASTTSLRTGSSTITNLTYTNASGTRLSTTQGLDSAGLRVIPDTTTSYGVSVTTGGVVNITNNNTTSTAFTIYSNQASPSGRTMVVNCDNRAQAQDCAVFFGTSSSTTVVDIQGSSTSKGVLKVEHFGTGDDANASAISIDTQGTGTNSQALFITSTGVSTGSLFHVTWGGGDIFNLKPITGFVISTGTSISSGPLTLGTTQNTVFCQQTYVKGTTTLFYIGVNTSTYTTFATSTKPSAFCN